MSTPQLYVKFSQPNGVTRAAVFTTSPTWDALTARIKSFFDIPESSVALTYIDADADEVTMDTQNELQELLSTLPNNTDSTTLQFVVRDMRGPRELHASEDTDRTMSIPSPGHDDLDELPVEQAVGPEVRGDGNEREQTMAPDDERNLFGRPAGMPTRGLFPLRGRGGHRGGRGGGRGGFGTFHSRHSRFYGPRGVPPFTLPFPGARGGGRFVSREPPQPPMSHETFRARSAPPELRADAPEDVFLPEDFMSFRRPGPPFGGPHTRSSRPTPEGGCDRRHYHQYGRGGFEKFGRGRGRGSPFSMERGRGGMFARGRGTGGLGTFGHVREGMFPDFAEHPFDFGGRRGGRFPPGFGNGNRGCPMNMGNFGFDDPRVVMVGVGI